MDKSLLFFLFSVYEDEIALFNAEQASSEVFQDFAGYLESKYKLIDAKHIECCLNKINVYIILVDYQLKFTKKQSNKMIV